MLRYSCILLIRRDVKKIRFLSKKIFLCVLIKLENLELK